MTVEALYGCRPSQTPENSITTASNFSPKLDNSQFLENLLQLRAQSEDRIPPPPEVQERVKPEVSTIVFNNRSKQHLEIVEARQKEFDLVLGNQRKDGQFLSHDPVFDRVNFELAETDKQREAVKIDTEKEVNATLRERLRTPLNIVTYVLGEDGIVYSEDDLRVPADIKFQDGASYRINHKSPEPEREQQTVEAGIVAKRKLADPNTPMHSKMIVVSPPGVVKGTAYEDNFVNIFEADQDPMTGKRIIRMFLFASSLSNDECKAVITHFQPDFFIGKTGAFDVQCLNPIFIDSRLDKRMAYELFNQEFKPQEGITKEADFQEILTKSLSVRQNYIDVVCGKVFNPREIAIAFNAVLNKADAIRREIINRGKGIINGFVEFGRRAVNTFNNIKDEVEWWGRQIVEKVMAGCGLSGGFSIKGSLRSFVSGVFGGIGGGIGSLFRKEGGVCVSCGENNTCTAKCYKCGGMLR